MSLKLRTHTLMRLKGTSVKKKNVTHLGAFAKELIENVQMFNPREKGKARLVFFAWGEFHARSRFARSTITEEKMGSTRSLPQGVLLI